MRREGFRHVGRYIAEWRVNPDFLVGDESINVSEYAQLAIFFFGDLM